MSILHEHGLTQHVNEQTHALGHILDIVNIYMYMSSIVQQYH